MRSGKKIANLYCMTRIKNMIAMILLQRTTFVMFVNTKYTRDNLFRTDS